uniref:T26-9p n=1 Tax=Thermococcus sp. 26/2 TaxID=758583 RepID=D6MY32_9EURY|nr:t26-9p [Thermococcus sp. 26/2]
MDANTVNSGIDAFKQIATAHPYLGLAILLFVIGALVRGKTALVFYALGALALLQSFGLFDTFISFLKQVPTLLKQLSSGLGGV